MKKYNYEYHNANPLNLELEDCVCRAISTATGLKYHVVENLLELNAKANNCDTLCLCCYHSLLTDTLGYEKHYCQLGETVGDIAKKYYDRKVIIRIDAHLTCSMYGVIADIWDCTEKLADIYWIID